MIKLDDRIVKVPYGALAVTIRKQDERKAIHFKNSIIGQKKVGNLVKIIAAFRYIQADMVVNQAVVEASTGGNGQFSHSEITRLYFQKNPTLKIRSKDGFQLYLEYDVNTRSIIKNRVKLRSAFENKHILLPNLYTNDGHICWGSDELPTFANFDDMVGGLFQVFLTSPFNRDLRNKEVVRGKLGEYLRSCIARVPDLEGWSTSEKMRVRGWLTSVLQDKVEHGTGLNVTIDAYTILLAANIFNDDIGYLSGLLSSKEIRFK